MGGNEGFDHLVTALTSWTDLKSVYGGLRQAMVSYRSWVDFLCIIQSDEKSNESEFYITDVFELK